MTASLEWLVISGLFGVAAGSFLNVVIYRLPRGQSIVHPRSRCTRCGLALAWFDNIPVLSWVALGGRCRQCRAPIGWRYPVVELVTAALAVAIVMTTPPGPLLASRLVFGAAMIVLFMIDLEHQLLPNVVTLPGILVGLVFSLFTPPGLLDAAVGAATGAGVLYAIAAGYYLIRREEGMGMGDVKMLAMIGAFLGWRAVLMTLVLSSFAGAIVGVGLLAFDRGGLRYALPFGTFLAVAAVWAMLAGDGMLAWYLAFYE
ncbi:MAG: prepilin peptidase [Acidobacteriota bacterium]